MTLWLIVVYVLIEPVYRGSLNLALLNILASFVSYSISLFDVKSFCQCKCIF